MESLRLRFVSFYETREVGMKKGKESIKYIIFWP